MKSVRAWGTADKHTRQVTATFIGESRQFVERQMASDGEKVMRVGNPRDSSSEERKEAMSRLTPEEEKRIRGSVASNGYAGTPKEYRVFEQLLSEIDALREELELVKLEFEHEFDERTKLIGKVKELKSALAAASLELQTARVEIARECRSCAQFETELAAKEEELQALKHTLIVTTGGASTQELATKEEELKALRETPCTYDHIRPLVAMTAERDWENARADRLEQREKRLREASAKFLAKLKECDKATTGIFTVAAIHGCNYDGPNYVVEREALEAALVEGESK